MNILCKLGLHGKREAAEVIPATYTTNARVFMDCPKCESRMVVHIDDDSEFLLGDSAKIAEPLALEAEKGMMKLSAALAVLLAGPIFWTEQPWKTLFSLAAGYLAYTAYNFAVRARRSEAVHEAEIAWLNMRKAQDALLISKHRTDRDFILQDQ